jgi:hypothetical protein
MLYVPTSTLNATPCVVPTPTVVTGRDIAHSHRTTVQLAFFAADWCLGRVQLVKPTIKQAAAIADVSYGYARAARRIAYCRPDLRPAIQCGSRPLIEPNVTPAIDALWSAMPASQRADFIHNHLSEVWTSLETATAA